MATRIPLPGTPMEGLMQGIKTGSGLYANAMHPILEREKQKQLERHFQEQLKLSKASAGRNAELFKYRVQELQDKHAAAQFERNMMNQLIGGGSIASDMSGAMPQEMPIEVMGQGKGVFTPEGLAEAQQALSSGKPESTGLNNALMNKLMQNPMLRGWFKHKFGYDPLAPVAQTPEEKNAAQLQLFRDKEEIKAANKIGSGEKLTAPIITKYQNVIGGVATARPILEKLIEATRKGEIPGQLFGALFNRNSQANYKSEISTLLDGIRNAYTIPNTDSGTVKAEDKVLRTKGETDANYIKRLTTILNQMDFREKDARAKLKAGNITARLVHLVGPNGEDYDVPEDEVETVLAENPGVRRG